jgi:hypothetical protein
MAAACLCGDAPNHPEVAECSEHAEEKTFWRTMRRFSVISEHSAPSVLNGTVLQAQTSPASKLRPPLLPKCRHTFGIILRQSSLHLQFRLQTKLLLVRIIEASPIQLADQRQ